MSVGDLRSYIAKYGTFMEPEVARAYPYFCPSQNAIDHSLKIAVRLKDTEAVRVLTSSLTEDQTYINYRPTLRTIQDLISTSQGKIKSYLEDAEKRRQQRAT